MTILNFENMNQSILLLRRDLFCIITTTERIVERLIGPGGGGAKFYKICHSSKILDDINVRMFNHLRRQLLTGLKYVGPSRGVMKQ